MHKSIIYSLLSTVFFLLCGNAQGQRAQCLVTDQEGEPIPYANVYFPDRSRGVLTDEKGAFTLDLEGGLDTSRITFSCLNYVPETRTVSLLRAQAGSDCRIELAENAYLLKTTEVVADRIKMRRRKIGVTGGINTAWFDFRTANPPVEIGTVMEVDERCRLENINIKIKEVEADSFLIEVSLYDYPFRGTVVGKMLLREREIHTISKGGLFTIDVSDQNIWVDNDFLVTFRMLKSGDSYGYVKMAARTKYGKGLINKGDGRWKDSYLYPTIRMDVSYVK